MQRFDFSHDGFLFSPMPAGPRLRIRHFHENDLVDLLNMGQERDPELEPDPDLATEESPETAGAGHPEPAPPEPPEHRKATGKIDVDGTQPRTIGPGEGGESI